ncbi:MAG: rRNA methyltransferase, partial [Rubrivivax sp. SCN 70-15]
MANDSLEHVARIRQRLRALGAAPAHEQRVLRLWSQARPQNSGRRRLEDFLPRALRDALPALEHELAAAHPASDGSARLLVALADGQTVEAVLLPKDGLCVSTQVGCAVGCLFCMTGQGGLLRQMGSAEIVAQVALARTLRPVRKVVFMGMGEPAHNLDAVLEAIELLGTAGGIGHKELVFSTVGDARAFERLLALGGDGAGAVKPALALSLHSTKPALREKLLPRAPCIAPAELVALGERYARASGHPVQLQWTLIEGVNDGDDEVDALAALLAGRHAMLNLIPYNAVDGLPWRRPARERAAAMAAALNRRGILTRLRRSAGQDVAAGCG